MTDVRRGRLVDFWGTAKAPTSNGSEFDKVEGVKDKKTACGGQMWIANKDTLMNPININEQAKNHSRRVVIDNGEIVEFRYWGPPHLRTIDDLYLSIDEKTFYENFDYEGAIFEEVNSRNKNTTEEIIKCRLYKKHHKKTK